MQSSTQINRVYGMNCNYFDKIDTQEKAYWLGFLWADGSITRTAKRASGPNRLRVTQKWSEREHLGRFRDALSSNYDIKHVNKDSSCSPCGEGTAKLDINCRPLCAALVRLGYGPKNLRVHIPKIHKSLICHFLRGYFDGDGCLSVYTQTVRQNTKQYVIRKQEWSLTGNATLMSEIKNVLSHEAGTTSTIRLKTYKRSLGTASLRYGKRLDIEILYAYLHKNATIYLPSKYKKFVEFFSRLAS